MCQRNVWCSMLVLIILLGVSSSSDPEFVSRAAWGARPPRAVDPMANPVPFVVIHHSYIPKACNTTEECEVAMRWMQDYHQLNHSWNDIGYHFAVGGDGKVYDGRGWSVVGAHAPRFNNISIGICVIGDWTEQLPPEQQLTTVHQLIEYGVREGKIHEDYILVGHRQTRKGTECPGDRLYSEIQTWEHWQSTPYPEGHEKDPITNHPRNLGNFIRKRMIKN